MKNTTLLLLLCTTLGCQEISGIVVTSPEPLEDSGVYSALVQVTCTDGSTYEDNIRFQLVVSTEDTIPGTEEDMVVVTKSGTKYHPLDSRYANSTGSRIITLTQAKAEGYQPSKAYQQSHTEDEA